MKHQQRIYMRKVADNAATILVFALAFFTVCMLVVIASRHEVPVAPHKTLTITGFQEPMLVHGYTFLDTTDKERVFHSVNGEGEKIRIDVKRDLGVVATIISYDANGKMTQEVADVWMWRVAQ